MTRQVRGLRPPPADLAPVPSTDRDHVDLHRATAARHPQPWWFSTRIRAGPDAGRFDIAGPRQGTCYLADAPVSALLERLADPEAGAPPLVSTRTLEAITVWSGRVSAAVNLADVTVASVPELTAEIATIDDYRLPWQWADALHGDGRGGIVYRGRFAQSECVALFGPASVPTAVPASTALRPSPAIAHERTLPPAWRAAVTRTPANGEHLAAPDL